MGGAAIGPVAGADKIVAKPEGLIVAPRGTGEEAGAILLAVGACNHSGVCSQTA